MAFYRWGIFDGVYEHPPKFIENSLAFPGKQRAKPKDLQHYDID